MSSDNVNIQNTQEIAECENKNKQTMDMKHNKINVLISFFFVPECYKIEKNYCGFISSPSSEMLSMYFSFSGLFIQISKTD